MGLLVHQMIQTLSSMLVPSQIEQTEASEEKGFFIYSFIIYF